MLKSQRRKGARLLTYATLLWLSLPGSRAKPQVRPMEDLRCPAPGITRVRLEQRADRCVRPTFVGDVDGDKFDDFLLFQFISVGNELKSRTLLVHGQAEYPPDLSLEELRSTRFPDDDRHSMNGVSAWSGSLTPYGPAGDVDGDGKADFFLGSGATSWDGNEFSGLALLVFGGDYPEEVSLAHAAAFGVRTKRFIFTEPHLVAGWSIAQVGDLNGDGYGEVAISAIRAPGSINGLEHGGRVYVLFGGPWLADAADVQLSEVGKSVGGFVL